MSRLSDLYASLTSVSVIINSLAVVVPRRRENVSMILEMTKDGKTHHVGEACTNLQNRGAFPLYTDQS
jgi:hypothetical protein